MLRITFDFTEKGRNSVNNLNRVLRQSMHRHMVCVYLYTYSTFDTT